MNSLKVISDIFFYISSMESVDEIYLFVCSVIRKNPDITKIFLKTSAENSESLLKAFKGFRSHILQVFDDYINVFKVSKNIIVPAGGLIINKDLLEALYLEGNIEGKDITFWPNGQMLSYKDVELGSHYGWYENGIMRLSHGAKIGKTKYYSWYPSGKLQYLVSFVDGLKHGIVIGIVEDNGEYCEFTYDSGILNGPYAYRNKNGVILQSGIYCNSHRDGKTYHFDSTGKKTHIVSYSAGKIVESRD